jgi:hypothetical protein
MARDADLAAEFAHLLIAFLDPDGPYLEYEPLQRGVVWGLARLAEVRPEFTVGAESHLRRLLGSASAEIRGLAVIALGRIERAGEIPELAALADDEAEFAWYEHGRVWTMMVKEAVRLEKRRTG